MMGAGYPDRPGWKGRETSRLPAESVAPKQKRLCELVLADFSEGPATPELITDRLNRPGGRRYLLMSLRPRCSGKKGLLRDTGRRGRGEGGGWAAVWALPSEPPPMLAAPVRTSPCQPDLADTATPLLAWAERALA